MLRAQLDPETRRLLTEIGGKIPEWWRADRFSRQQKKALLRCLIDKVVLRRIAPDRVILPGRLERRGNNRSRTAGNCWLLVTSLRQPRDGATDSQLARQGKTDDDIARILTKRGYHSPRHMTVLRSNRPDRTTALMTRCATAANRTHGVPGLLDGITAYHEAETHKELDLRPYPQRHDSSRVRLLSEGCICSRTLPRLLPDFGSCGRESSTLYVFRRVSRCHLELRLQIRVIDLAKPRVDMVTDRVDRLVSVSSWTKPKRAVQEVSLKDRLNHQQHHGLNDPVSDSWNSQRSLPAVRFRDINAFDRLRTIAFGAKLFVHLPYVGVPGRFIQCDEVLTGDTIHPGKPPLPDSTIALLQSAVRLPDRSGRTRCKTGTWALAWPFDPVSFSVRRLFGGSKTPDFHSGSASCWSQVRPPCSSVVGRLSKGSPHF